MDRRQLLMAGSAVAGLKSITGDRLHPPKLPFRYPPVFRVYSHRVLISHPEITLEPGDIIMFRLREYMRDRWSLFRLKHWAVEEVNDRIFLTDQDRLDLANEMSRQKF